MYLCKCFVIVQVFWNLWKCFVFVEVFCDLWKCFVPMRHHSKQSKHKFKSLLVVIEHGSRGVMGPIKPRAGYSRTVSCEDPV